MVATLTLSSQAWASDSELEKNTGVAHSVVVYPNSTADVVKVMKIANKYRMPIVPYAGGTSLEGHLDRKSVV